MSLHNQILEAAEQKIESQLLPDVKADYTKIVVAGMKVAAHNGPNGMLSGLKRQPDPVGACAIGAINLVVMMSKQSQGVMPVKAMGPAAADLMLHALDLVDMGRHRQDRPLHALGRASYIFANHWFKVFGITLPMLNAAASHVHSIVQDPTKMELINRRVGLVKAPGASEPTTIPGAPTSEGTAPGLSPALPRPVP